MNKKYLYSIYYKMVKIFKPTKVVITKSDRDKKMKAVFYNKDKKIKTTHFGAKGMSDYTIHKDDKRKERYLARHNPKNTKENWNDPMTAGALSRYILWNKKTLKDSINDYKRRFKLS
tara:strand:+ start:657 stop:1007 length:351 start_codon:yes stop_codon:yes gene_type:complete